MQVTDKSYLDQFRKLTATKKKIASTIRDFEAICQSLKDWQKTSREIATVPGNHPEWSDDHVKAILELRPLLVKYHTEAETLGTIWRELTEEQRCGLADLQTIHQP